MRPKTRRHRPEPSPPDPGDPAAALAQRDPELAAERRLRAAGGPEDRSLYRCACGYIFDAAVSTDVACPHCGTTQAW